MRCATLILAALALLLSGGPRVRGAVIVQNTFGPGDLYSIGSGYTVSGSGFAGYNSEAAGFTPAQTTNLTQVRFAAVDLTFPGLAVDVLLANADGSGNPGSIVQTLGIVTPGSSFHSAIITLDTSAHPVLTAGTPYWLLLQPDLPGSNLNMSWPLSDPPALGPVVNRGSPNGSWLFTAALPQPAFEILGTPAAVATPEPSILVELAMATITGVGYFGWRRRRERFIGPGAPLSLRQVPVA